MGFTVIIAVIGHLLFDKTGIPESIFMIVLGLFLGPYQVARVVCFYCVVLFI